MKLTGKRKFIIEFLAKELVEKFELKTQDEGLKLLFKSLEYNVVSSEIAMMADFLIENGTIKIEDGIIEVIE
jgi:hypothetical protein